MKKLAIAFLSYLLLCNSSSAYEERYETMLQLADAAFSCAILNSWIGNEEEARRLHDLGLTNAREVAKHILSNNEGKQIFSKSKYYGNSEFMEGLLVGFMNSSASDITYKQIFIDDAFDKNKQVLNAKILITQKNCRIIK